MIVAPSKVSFDPAYYNQSVPNFNLVDEMLLYAKDFERIEARSMAGLLDELGRVNNTRFSGRHIHWTNKRKLPSKPRQHDPQVIRIPLEEHQDCPFLPLAIQAGLRLYVQEKVECNKTLMT